VTTFYQKIRHAKKILVLDLGFLGDTVTLLPALSVIRKACPRADFSVMVESKVVSLLQLTPWIDHVFGYPRFPKGPKWYQDFGRVLNLRREHYDVIINLNGSDRSSLLTLFSGATHRLGRVPYRKKSRFWRYCFTDTVEVPYHTQHLSHQRLDCLHLSGFPKEISPDFDVVMPENAFEKIRPSVGTTPFIHVSPFTTMDKKELPAEQLVELLGCLDFPFVLSCAPNEREQTKLKALLSSLKKQPLAVFAGSLNIVELTALISLSQAHLCGDSGSLHLAVMLKKPTFAWFRETSGVVEWAPTGDTHVNVFGDDGDPFLKIPQKKLEDTFRAFLMSIQ